MRTLWIFGHQLSMQLQGFQRIDQQKDRILFIEAKSRATWKQYHKKKLVLIFSAMRHFAKALQEDGYTVDYRIADSFEAGWRGHMAEFAPTEVLLHEPTDWKMRKILRKWAEEQQKTGLSVTRFEENLFLVPEQDWQSYLPENKSWKLDTVYQKLRRVFGVLMEGQKPVGGKWSFDQENRKPPKAGLSFFPPMDFAPDAITLEVIAQVNAHFPDNPGTTEGFLLPVTAAEARKAWEHFLETRLPVFGEYQDAMLTGLPYMAHSLISSAMNIGLLDPLSVIREAEGAYHAGKVSLSSAEGFIRQILGWREYMRGVYLSTMPQYQEVNVFEHEAPLPALYWHAKTRMHCLSQCVQEVLHNGYNHHIQRLMVLGNFANLAGTKPQEVAEWFNVMYTDAHDWVVLPNVLGMALYADGGTLSTKPYISTGQYVNKMSDYCKGCYYKVTEKLGERACPFNALYWDFLMRHEEKLRGNPRMGMMYQVLGKMSETEHKAIRQKAKQSLEALRKGEL